MRRRGALTVLQEAGAASAAGAAGAAGGGAVPGPVVRQCSRVLVESWEMVLGSEEWATFRTTHPLMADLVTGGAQALALQEEASQAVLELVVQE